MSFGRPDLLPVVVLLPAFIAILIWVFALRRRRVVRSLGEGALIERIGGADLERFPLGRLLLIGGAAAALGVAAADPRWGTHVTEQQSSSLNIVLAMDVSKSMLAEDVEPNRLEQQRLLGRRVLRDLPGDRFGLVAFAGRAYILSPLTIDYSALNLYLDALAPEIVSQGGTSIAASLAQATDLVRGSEQYTGGQRIVVLVSDGEALEDREPIDAAAERAARAGVKIFTVGVGTPSGAPVPERDPVTGRTTGFKQDVNGEVVISRLDEGLLRDIAERTGGEYLRLDTPGAAARLVTLLRARERTTGPAGRLIEQRQRFAMFVALALLLLAVDLVRQRAPRRPTITRVEKATAGAVLVLLLGAWGPGDLERGNRLYREGRYAEAVEAYQSALRDGDSSPRLYYNLGTALVRLGRFAEADPFLRQALDGIDPELRRRAFFNLGNRFLEEARGGAEQRDLLGNAIEAFKRALRLTPEDIDAKWNLELALRERERQEQEQQDRENEEQPQNPAQGGASTEPEPDDRRSMPQELQGEMSREQAERILSAVEQDERDLTRDRLQRGQRRTPVRRDW